jgi:hypothetical protein
MVPSRKEYLSLINIGREAEKINFLLRAEVKLFPASPTKMKGRGGRRMSLTFSGG